MEFILIGTRNMLNMCSKMQITISNDIINNVDSAKNLGIHSEKHLKNTIHINKLSSALFCITRNIARVHQLLEQQTIKIMDQPLIILRLDYCNSLMLGSSKYSLDKLQKIQNMACRVVVNIRKYDSITPHLKNLHWLKINERIEYKIAVMMYKCVNNLTSKYLSDPMFTHHHRHLRSTTFDLNPHPTRFRTEQVHKASFKSQGPTI